jgi:hypothetical protein
MSKDNLILFPEKRKSIISMTRNEAKLMLSGSLFLILTLALGINGVIFSQNSASLAQKSSPESAQDRSLASINPIFKVSWEKRAFEVLAESDSRELASVSKPISVLDELSLGFFEGNYQVKDIDGKISQIQFFNQADAQPKKLSDRQAFFSQHLSLFADKAQRVVKMHVVDNNDILLEKYSVQDAKGQDLSTIQVLMDKNNNLISMTVQ